MNLGGLHRRNVDRPTARPDGPNLGGSDCPPSGPGTACSARPANPPAVENDLVAVIPEIDCRIRIDRARLLPADRDEATLDHDSTRESISSVVPSAITIVSTQYQRASPAFSDRVGGGAADYAAYRQGVGTRDVED